MVCCRHLDDFCDVAQQRLTFIHKHDLEVILPVVATQGVLVLLPVHLFVGLLAECCSDFSFVV